MLNKILSIFLPEFS